MRLIHGSDPDWNRESDDGWRTYTDDAAIPRDKA